MESKVMAMMGEVKDVVFNIGVDSQIFIVISLVIVDMPPLNGMFLRREWINAIRALINSIMDTITFSHHKDIITLLREGRYKEQIHDKDNQEAHNKYLLESMGTYIVFGEYDHEFPMAEEEQYYAKAQNEGQLWTMSFDGAKSKNRVRTGFILQVSNGSMHTFSYRLNFECTNNVAKYKALVPKLFKAI